MMLTEISQKMHPRSLQFIFIPVLDLATGPWKLSLFLRNYSVWQLYHHCFAGKKVRNSKFGYKCNIRWNIVNALWLCWLKCNLIQCQNQFSKQQGNDSVSVEDLQNKLWLLLTWCRAEQCPTLGKYFLFHFHKYLCNFFWETYLLQKTELSDSWHTVSCLHLKDLGYVCLKFLISPLAHPFSISFFPFKKPNGEPESQKFGSTSGVWTFQRLQRHFRL